MARKFGTCQTSSRTDVVAAAQRAGFPVNIDRHRRVHTRINGCSARADVVIAAGGINEDQGRPSHSLSRL